MKIRMKCYSCCYIGDKDTFTFKGVERVEGHEFEKYECPKCGEIYWTETQKSYDRHNLKEIKDWE